jgi:4'-phosphopantetheinyl transferase
VQAGHKSPTTDGCAGVASEITPDLSIFLVDLVRSEACLDAEEARTPRLSDADAERAAEIADASARRHWRASRIATRIVLERFGGPGLRRLPFRTESGGRPFLGEDSPQFSVSHTAGSALIAVSKIAPVGVDIEARKRGVRISINRRIRLVRAAERLGLRAQLSPEVDADILCAWVQLEAIAKALGIGIGRLLTAEGVVGGAKANVANGLQHALDVRSLHVGDDCVAAIAAKRLPRDLIVEAFPVADLAEFLDSQCG